MIMYGTNIQSPADPLRKVQVEAFFHSVKNPKAPFAAMIRQLRVAYQINAKHYATLKRSLPYAVCGMFTPPYRRTENFGYTEYFIIDIDHLSSKSLSLNDLRSRIQADRRVRLCFASPSEDGLKVMFRLSNRCYDAGQYSVFYKEFLKRFSEQYHLEQVIDPRTSDVCRACFASADPEAYFNNDSEPVNIDDYLDTNNPLSMFDLKSDQGKASANAQKQSAHAEPHPIDPDKDVMERIKQRLNSQGRETNQKPEAFVPQQLVEITDSLKAYIEETGLVVSETINIQYGRKFRIKMGKKEAEINLFYGRRGFTVVKSPRCGTNAELNDISAQLIQGFIDTL